MNVDGLQAIQNRILKEAEATAAAILEQARSTAAESDRQAETQVAILRTEALGRADVQTAAILSRAASTAAMDSRRQQLLARQQLIDQVILMAGKQLHAMPDQEKLALYVNMVNSLQAESGEIALAQNDSHLGAALLEKLGPAFTLATQPGEFEGGVVLRRDRIEDNLTFDLMIRHERPRLSALAAQVLFEAQSAVLPDLDSKPVADAGAAAVPEAGAEGT